MGKYNVNISLETTLIATAKNGKELEQRIDCLINQTLKCCGEKNNMYIKINATPYDIMEYDIMNRTKGHTIALVEEINRVYNERPDRFEEILMLLAKRDSGELEEHNVVSFGINTSYDEIAHIYLQRIADDLDLETIIKYCK